MLPTGATMGKRAGNWFIVEQLLRKAITQVTLLCIYLLEKP